MNRKLNGWITLLLFAVLLTAFFFPVGSAAQTADNEIWQFVEAPYLVGASMGGTVALHGNEVEVNASGSDIVAKLQFGFMNYFEARKGNWGFSNDIMYVALGGTSEEPSANIDPTGLVVSLFGTRRLNKNVDLLFGARINAIKLKIEFKDLGRTLEQDKTWVDPVAGIRFSAPMGDRWRIGIPASFGGFGLGSKISIDAFPNAQLRLSSTTYLAFGWRFLYINYEDQPEQILPIDGQFLQDTEGFRYDVLSQGPGLGLVFRFCATSRK